MTMTLQPIWRAPRALVLAAPHRGIDAPSNLLSITPLPEVTVLSPEDGWRAWDMAVRLQDAAASADLRSAA